MKYEYEDIPKLKLTNKALELFLRSIDNKYDFHTIYRGEDEENYE
jgi:hypothetical protein